MHPAAAKIVALYERHAADFDRERGRGTMEAAWLDRLLVLMPGPTLLDIGCGMGEPIARYCIDRARRVTGIDSSAGMIALCRSRFPLHDWRQADMRTLALATRFDGLVAWDSFFHLSQADQRGMFAVFAAHAAPGAPLLFTSGPQQGEAIGRWHGEDLYHASLDPGEYRALLDRHGFAVVDHVPEDPACGGHTVWLAQARRPAET